MSNCEVRCCLGHGIPKHRYDQPWGCTTTHRSSNFCSCAATTVGCGHFNSTMRGSGGAPLWCSAVSCLTINGISPNRAWPLRYWQRWQKDSWSEIGQGVAQPLNRQVWLAMRDLLWRHANIVAAIATNLAPKAVPGVNCIHCRGYPDAPCELTHKWNWFTHYIIMYIIIDVVIVLLLNPCTLIGDTIPVPLRGIQQTYRLTRPMPLWGHGLHSLQKFFWNTAQWLGGKDPVSILQTRWSQTWPNPPKAQG